MSQLFAGYGDGEPCCWKRDPNDQMSEAIVDDGGETVSGVISASGTLPDPGTDVGDVDLWRFTVMAGQRVGFDVDRASGNLDSYIRVFTDAGNQVGSMMIGLGLAGGKQWGVVPGIHVCAGGDILCGGVGVLQQQL